MAAPRTPMLAQRPGAAAPAQRVQAAPAPYRQPVAFPDGLALTVVGVQQQTVTGKGAGVVTGAPFTLLTLRLANGTPEPLDLDGVVVTTTYGPGDQVAPPVYGGDIADFSGRLAAGASATATYAFSIRVEALDRVVTSIDVDGRHGLAVFTGSAR